MQAKNKILGLAFGLVLPYMALAMYFVLRGQGRPHEQPLPAWFPYFAMAYLSGTTLLISVMGRRIARTAQAKSPQNLVKPGPAMRIALRVIAGYLVAVWCGGLLYGAVETIRGRFEWQRALLAGIWLLIFIVLFARWLYIDIKSQRLSNKRDKS